MYFKIALWMITYRTYFRRLSSYHNMSAVTAFPYLNFTLFKHLCSFNILEKHHEERYRALLKNIETAQVFEKSEVKVWECRNCGHIVVGTKAPEVCPVCNHPQSYFEVHEENY